VEKKSQGNAERHFQFPMYGLTKEGISRTRSVPRAQHCLENNFETAGLRREFQQSGTNDRKETGPWSHEYQ